MPAALVGHLALGLGPDLLFVGQAHVGHAFDGVSLDLERPAHELDPHLKLAQRVRLDRALDLALEQQLTC